MIFFEEKTNLENISLYPERCENAVNEAVNTIDSSSNSKKNLCTFFYKLLGAPAISLPEYPNLEIVPVNYENACRH